MPICISFFTVGILSGTQMAANQFSRILVHSNKHLTTINLYSFIIKKTSIEVRLLIQYSSVFRFKIESLWFCSFFVKGCMSFHIDCCVLLKLFVFLLICSILNGVQKTVKLLLHLFLLPCAKGAKRNQKGTKKDTNGPKGVRPESCFSELSWTYFSCDYFAFHCLALA